MEQRLVKIGAAAEMLGTKPDTLRKRERTGELLPKRKTRAGTAITLSPTCWLSRTKALQQSHTLAFPVTTRKPT